MCLALFICVIKKYVKKRGMRSRSKCWNSPRKTISFLKHLQKLSQFISTFHVLPISIPASLQEESLTYEGQLDSLEAEILMARQEHQNMQAMYNDAQLSKETAKVIQTSSTFSSWHACLSWRHQKDDSSPLLPLLMIQFKWVNQLQWLLGVYSPVFLLFDAYMQLASTDSDTDIISVFFLSS